MAKDHGVTFKLKSNKPLMIGMVDHSNSIYTMFTKNMPSIGLPQLSKNWGLNINTKFPGRQEIQVEQSVWGDREVEELLINGRNRLEDFGSVSLAEGDLIEIIMED